MDLACARPLRMAERGRLLLPAATLGGLGRRLSLRLRPGALCPPEAARLVTNRFNAGDLECLPRRTGEQLHPGLYQCPDLVLGLRKADRRRAYSPAPPA